MLCRLRMFRRSSLMASALLLLFSIGLFISSSPVRAEEPFVQSLMRIYTSRGKVSVYLNGKKIGDYKGLTNVSIDPYVKPGQNTMKIVWIDRTSGHVKIAHAKTRNAFKDVTNIEIMYADGKKAGSESVTFALPEAKK